MVDERLPRPPRISVMPETDREFLAKLIQSETRKVHERIDGQDERIGKLEEAMLSQVVSTRALQNLTRASEELRADVRRVLGQDERQEERLLALEKAARSEGHDAGKSSGARMGATAAALVSVLVYLLQQFAAALPPALPQKQSAPNPTHQPTGH